MLIVYICLTLVFIAFFAGIEIAYITANRLPIELKKRAGSKRGKILSNLFDHPADFLATTLVGNNIVLVMYSLLLDTSLEHYFEAHGIFESRVLSLVIATLISTLILLVVAEFIPKSLFRLSPGKILWFFTYPIVFFRFILKPIVWVMVTLSDWVLKKVFNLEHTHREKEFTKMDLENFINNSRPDAVNVIDRELFQNALYLNDIRIRECMVPRLELEFVDVDADIDVLRRKVVDTGLSRILICEDSIDEIVGYIHHTQILTQGEKTLREMAVPMPIVPETMLARDLLNDLVRAGQSNMAWVVDEYGGTAGIVTLEDILEEIFGDIDDEYDHDSDYTETVVTANEFVFSGRLELSYLNEKYKLNLPEDEYQTLSGYIISIEENIPPQGKEILSGDYEFIIEEVGDTKIETVRLRRLLNKLQEREAKKLADKENK